jgi:hypothetical protein
MPQLTKTIILAAIEGFESQKQKLDAQINELRGLLDGNAPKPAATPQTDQSTPKVGRGRRRLSVAARARIAEAQRKRWAVAKGQAGPTPTTSAQPIERKRKLSAAGRRAIIEATKKRWAAVRAAKQAPAHAKKAAAKRKMSAAARAKLVANLAKARAAKAAKRAA